MKKRKSFMARAKKYKSLSLEVLEHRLYLYHRRESALYKEIFELREYVDREKGAIYEEMKQKYKDRKIYAENIDLQRAKDLAFLAIEVAHRLCERTLECDNIEHLRAKANQCFSRLNEVKNMAQRETEL
jgi:hypothetical protein